MESRWVFYGPENGPMAVFEGLRQLLLLLLDFIVPSNSVHLPIDFFLCLWYDISSGCLFIDILLV